MNEFDDINAEFRTAAGDGQQIPTREEIEVGIDPLEPTDEAEIEAEAQREAAGEHTQRGRWRPMSGSANGSRLPNATQWPENEPPPPPIEPIGIGQLLESHPDMRPIVVDGVLRRGETGNIIASTKVGKSFLAGNLAWCIATGTPWLGHDVAQGRVLIIDNELHREVLANRLYRIATEMMIDVREYENAIDVIPLRGQNVDIHAFQSRIAEIEPGAYTLCLMDALYRTLPDGTSENDNAQMMAIYNRLDHYASEWDCAIAVVHHSSKGQQGDKRITDVGSGAGAISRAADTHIAIRPHEDEELSVLEVATRSFPPPEPVSLRWEYPLWHVASAEPVVKKPSRGSAEAKAKEDQEAMAELLKLIPEQPTSIQQKRLFEQVGHGESKCRRLVGKLVSESQVTISRKRKKGSKRTLIFYSRLADSEGNSGSDSG